MSDGGEKNEGGGATGKEPKRHKAQASVPPRITTVRRHKQSHKNPSPPEEDTGRKSHDRFDWVSMCLTAGGFLAAAAAAGAAFWLALDTDKLIKGGDQASINADLSSFRALIRAHMDSDTAVKEARDDASKALKLAGDTAGAQERLTTESNEINKNAFTGSQRAFVVIPEIKREIINGPEVDPTNGKVSIVQYWRFSVTLENSGNTPTRNLRFSSGVANNLPFYTESLPYTFGPYSGLVFPPGLKPYPLRDLPADPLEILTKAPLRRYVLGPRAVMTTDYLQVSTDGLKALAREGNRLYFVGYATYSDAIGSGSHVTRYCYILGGIGFLDDKPEIIPCRHWNCADEECTDDKQEYQDEVDRVRSPPKRP